jgi:hypothetical protein
VKIGAGYGDRTQLTRFSKVVMTRDFWSEGFDPQGVVGFLTFAVVAIAIEIPSIRVTVCSGSPSLH